MSAFNAMLAAIAPALATQNKKQGLVAQFQQFASACDAAKNSASTDLSNMLTAVDGGDLTQAFTDAQIAGYQAMIPTTVATFKPGGAVIATPPIKVG